MNIQEIKNGQAGQNFPALLKKHGQEIARALPRHLNPERMNRVALTEFRRNPALGKCDPLSVFAAVIQSAQLGLEPGIIGQSFLIPYGPECALVPGWMGLNDIVCRSGKATTWTGAVFNGDEFDFALGDSPFVRHRPGPDNDPDQLTHVYAIGRIKGSDWPIIEVWTAEKVRHHRDRYNKVGTRHYSFRYFEMYARKVALLQVLKYMPKSVELSTAMELDHSANDGAQGLTVASAIDGSWTREPDRDFSAPAAPAAQSQPAAQTEQPAAPVEQPQWPLKSGDSWADSTGEMYDRARHSWSAEGQPAVTNKGVFRKRRGAKKTAPEAPTTPADAPPIESNHDYSQLAEVATSEELDDLEAIWEGLPDGAPGKAELGYAITARRAALAAPDQ